MDANELAEREPFSEPQPIQNSTPPCLVWSNWLWLSKGSLLYFYLHVFLNARSKYHSQDRSGGALKGIKGRSGRNLWASFGLIGLPMALLGALDVIKWWGTVAAFTGLF